MTKKSEIPHTRRKVPDFGKQEETLKKQKIRNSEYYDMQLALDELYAASVKGQRFCNLVELIKRPENIKLAYRNIRKNSGSRTAGVDNKTISDLNKWNENALVAHVQRKLDWYIPNAVRRVEIPKDNGKTRPLGIPTIMAQTFHADFFFAINIPQFITDFIIFFFN